MRKTSHDGGDSTSITSGVESEIRKSAMKPKKSSLKRKTPNFSHESDDTVIEPLLQKDKGKTETNQSAKYFTKPKTDFIHEENSDKAKLLKDNKVKATTTTGFCGTTESLLSMKECDVPKATSGVALPIHNYMNTNVFNTHDNSKANVTAKTQILVEIDGSKQSGYNPSPLIFTTAKIHTDAKSKHMEPVQMTPVPILSTTEVTMAMDGSFTTNEKKISNGCSIMNPVCSQIPLDLDNEQKSSASNSNTVRLPTTISKDTFGKSNPITSAVKLSNNTSVPSSIENNLPSTTSKTVSMINNTNNQYQKQETSRDNKIDQPVPKTISPQLKSFGLDKNNVTVKTSAIGNVFDFSIKSAKSGQGDTSDKAQINKLVANSDNKTSTDLSGKNNLHSTNIKSPTTSKSSIEISNTKKICSSGNKQLQRQKTITDEKSTIESNVKPDTEQREALNAKTPVSHTPSQSRAIASISSENCDKLSELSANNAQNTVAKLNLNTTANITTNASSISLSAKPIDTCVNSSSSITSNISSIPTNTDTIVPLAKSSTNVPSNKNSSKPALTPITVSMIVTKSPATSVAKTSSIPTSIKSVKLPDGNSVHHTSSVGKTTVAKTPSLTTSITHATTSVNSVSSKYVTGPTTQPSPIVISASIATNNIIDNSKSKTSVAKLPSVTTSTKPTSVSTSTNIKPSPTAGQVATNTKLSTASAQSGSVKNVPTMTTSIPTIPVSTIPSKTTIAQNTTSDQKSTNKQSTKPFSVSAITKIPSSTTSAKPAMATSNTTSAKTPTESSSISTTTKPSTTPTIKSIPLATTSVKKTAVSPSTSLASPFVAKSMEASSSATIKESTSTKKPIVSTKSSSTTNIPPVSNACAVEGAISKTPSTSNFSMTTTKSAVTSNKTVPVKTPTVTTSTKMPLVTSASATTYVTSTKTNTMNPPQISSNTSVGIVGKSVASSTPVLKDSELVKKGGTKSSENKDGKDTKA